MKRKKNNKIMLEKNKIYLMDCMEGLKKLDDNSVDLFLFSPPYNKKGMIKYDNYDDDLPEDVYKKWQIDIINLCIQKLKPTGSIFYQHKNNIDKGIIIPYEWISKSNCKVFQLITWNRGGSQRLNKDRFLPTTENIWWLIPKKCKHPRFERQETLGEVWNIPADTKNEHPAPYPVKLAENVIKNVLGSKEMKAKLGNLLVVDCFMGSGTTAVAAKKLGCDYIGFDISEDYIKMANERIASTECKTQENNTIWD